MCHSDDIRTREAASKAYRQQLTRYVEDNIDAALTHKKSRYYHYDGAFSDLLSEADRLALAALLVRMEAKYDEALWLVEENNFIAVLFADYFRTGNDAYIHEAKAALLAYYANRIEDDLTQTYADYCEELNWEHPSPIKRQHWRYGVESPDSYPTAADAAALNHQPYYEGGCS